MSADDQRNQISLFGDLLAPPVEKPSTSQPKPEKTAAPAIAPTAAEPSQPAAPVAAFSATEPQEPETVIPAAKKKAALAKRATAAASVTKLAVGRQAERSGRVRNGAAPAAPSRSGLVPEGDVRLTANIRQDLHLRLKIAAATRRTTVGELIEEFVEKHL